MSLKFCKKCGTLYDDKTMECPKCNARELEREGASILATDGGMTDEEESAQRKKSWIQLLIGIPAFIGLLYLAGYLLKLVAA